MAILATIFRHPYANPHGTTVERQAARGIILNRTQLLLVYSPVAREYKFPGGGVNNGETPVKTLEREVLEECGARVTRVVREIGFIVEYANAVEPKFETFKMTSHIFLCQADAFVAPQKLGGYEIQLAFQPCWVEINQALEHNKSRLESSDPSPWLAREIFMLEYVKDFLL